MTEQTHHRVGMMNPAGSTKVSASHLQRDTYVYVRQSTLHQVQQNQREHAAPIRPAGTGGGAGMVRGAGACDRL